MQSGSRALLGLLVLGLSLLGPSLSQCKSLNSGEPSDVDAVRRLTREYALAIASGDPDRIDDYWNPQSPNLKARLRYYQNLVSEARIEFLQSQINRVEITEGHAASQLTTDERRLDRKTGAELLTFSPIRGACRRFEWAKIDGTWKIEREVVVQEELAAKLEAAKSVRERDELLEKEKVFVTNALILALSGRGFRYSARSEHETALRCFQLQLEVAERIGDQVGIAGAWLNSGHMKYQLDDYEVALQYSKKALAIYESIGLRRGVAHALERFSHIYRALGDYKRAFDCAQKSLRLNEEEKNRRGIVLALSELAIIYGDQNNSEQSLAQLERALAIASELGDKILTATMRHDAAVGYFQLGNYKRALEIYQELLKQTEGFGDRGGAAMVRDQIGKVLVAQGNYDEALNYFKQSLAEHEAVNMKRATSVVLNDITHVYLAQKRFEEALPSAEQSVALSRETRRQMDLWWALTLLGQCLAGLNRNTEAGRSFSEAVSIAETLRTQAAGGVEERQRYFEVGLRAHHGLLGVLVKENQAYEALVLGERAKARGLLDMLFKGEINVQKSMTPEERNEERKLKSELTQLNKRFVIAPQSDERVPEVEAQLEKARLNYEAFRNSLYSAHPELKVQRGEATIINDSELASLVTADTTLLEYVVTDTNTYLFVITKSPTSAAAKVRVFTLAITREELAAQTEAFRLQLARRDLGFRASAAQLFKLLLKPAEAELRGKTNLVIVPDQTLWDLPFQALVTDANRYLLEQASVSYAPSLTVLREMSRRRRITDDDSLTLLAVGNPTRKAMTIVRASFVTRDALPETEQEVKTLRQLYGAARSRIYVGVNAGEDVVKSEASHARILHFATHGTLNNVSPMYSNLELTPGHANEDGLLEAWELMQLDLKAELAVLSACETARGRIGPGEGIIGMSWAMFIAGVPSVVVSQWKVEAAGTRDLMVSFHRDLISNKFTKSEALRQASLKLMKNPETSHPFYWAGFVLVGDGK